MSEAIQHAIVSVESEIKDLQKLLGELRRLRTGITTSNLTGSLLRKARPAWSEARRAKFRRTMKKKSLAVKTAKA